MNTLGIEPKASYRSLFNASPMLSGGRSARGWRFAIPLGSCASSQMTVWQWARAPFDGIWSMLARATFFECVVYVCVCVCVYVCVCVCVCV